MLCTWFLGNISSLAISEVQGGFIDFALIGTILFFCQDVSSECTSAINMPGRNICNFLSLFNLAVWLIITFECQNITSTAIEAQVFGLTAWVIIQRMTLPLCIFFRFHASMFSFELWKEYSGKDDEVDDNENA